MDPSDTRRSSARLPAPRQADAPRGCPGRRLLPGPALWNFPPAVHRQVAGSVGTTSLNDPGARLAAQRLAYRLPQDNPGTRSDGAGARVVYSRQRLEIRR